MQFFAQMPDALTFGGWMLCLAAALSMLRNGSDVVQRWKGKPPPEQLEFAGDMLEKRMGVIENSIERVRGEQDERRRAIYKEIEKLRDENTRQLMDIARDISALQANSDLTNARLVQMDSKIDRLIERKH